MPISTVNIVKRFCGQGVYVVSEVPLVDAPSELPMGSVGMQPQNWRFNGKGYDCTAPGFYAFWSGFGTPMHGRLLWGGTLYEKMSAVSWNHIHGLQDEGLTGQLLANAGMTHKWRLRCGYIVDLVAWLQTVGYFSQPVRKVQLLTVDGPFNGVDDGHVALEVYDEGKWKLWDVSNGCIFRSTQGAHLSAAEILDAGVLNCVREPIDGDDKVPADVVATYNNYWCFSRHRDLVRRTHAEIDAWFARIFQAWNPM